jgi:ADP-heptose:LPS heptosyltransferase
VKVLIVRFSSIGDIVLTSPVVRCLKQQVRNIEIHYLTKKSFQGIVYTSPYISKVFVIENKLNEVIPELIREKYDHIIDLHHNLRTLQLKTKLKSPASSFRKLNYEKWLIVNLKVNKLPVVHIVDRYFDTVRTLGVRNDNKGLDYFILPINEIDITTLDSSLKAGYYALVIGGSYYTKQIPLNKLIEICDLSDKPIVVLGGSSDKELALKLIGRTKTTVVNVCGKYNLDQSASIIKQSLKVISPDTGLMHIAAAFKRDIISLWGNTIPEFGMSPYLPGINSKILEVKGLSCRPCSKLGFKKCPKGHFKCMNEIRAENVF